jgi:hypothetical protein
VGTLNVQQKTRLKTHEGGNAARISTELELRRSVLACLLWEDTFYESGISIAERIDGLAICPSIKPEIVANIAIEAREQMKLRHVPLLVANALTKRCDIEPRSLIAKTITQVIQRPDELTEFLAIYFNGGNRKHGVIKDKAFGSKLSNQAKIGLRNAFSKFDTYQFGKYNRTKDKIWKLKDAMCLAHPKSSDADIAVVFHKLKHAKTIGAKTWETRLSTGTAKKTEADKQAVWTSMLKENKLGAMALLRNLRNMQQVNVDAALIRASLLNMNVNKILPFRFISAAKHAVDFEPELETAMLKRLASVSKLKGKTVLLIDVSGSMNWKISDKSEVMREDAANALAMFAREICEVGVVYTFSNRAVKVPPRRGFGLRDAMHQSQSHAGTRLSDALKHIHNTSDRDYDRIIVITDEQSHDGIRDPIQGSRGYVVNVAPYENGVGYGKWTHIDGFSEATLDYIREFEAL